MLYRYSCFGYYLVNALFILFISQTARADIQRVGNGSAEWFVAVQIWGLSLLNCWIFMKREHCVANGAT